MLDFNFDLDEGLDEELNEKMIDDNSSFNKNLTEDNEELEFIPLNEDDFNDFLWHDDNDDEIELSSGRRR